MTKFFKNENTDFQPFCPFFGKNKFSEKNGLCWFLVYYQFTYHYAKTQNKNNGQLPKKLLTDRQTDRQQ